MTDQKVRVAIVGVGFLRGYRGARLTLRTLGQVFVDTGIAMINLILVVAAAGFVIGVLNIILMTAIATLSAFLYNICASLVGGVQLTLTDD